MNLTNQTRSVRWFLAIVLGAVNLSAADFTVVATFPTFTINTFGNPTLTLRRGTTYIFSGSNGSHPFYIKSVQGNTTANTFTNGVTGSGMTGSAPLTFAVPTNAPATLFYNCAVHSSMTGTINIVDPPVPPPFSIVGLTVSNNISLKYTGTNGFTYTPEANTNLGATNWFALTVQTNMILSGTNEVICGLPSGSNVFFRIRAQ